eukprot:symbB.v1.2.025719.t2/scaffold2509.1/size77380/6
MLGMLRPDLRGGAVLNVLSGLFAEGGLLNPQGLGSWLFQAVFSKHPQQAEGCCNNRSSAFLVFLACQRSSKRPWSSASWRLMTLDLNDLQIFLLSRSTLLCDGFCSRHSLEVAVRSAAWRDPEVKMNAPNCRPARNKALHLLMEALEAVGPNSHPWAAEFVAWQLEAHLQEELCGVPMMLVAGQSASLSGNTEPCFRCCRGFTWLSFSAETPATKCAPTGESSIGEIFDGRAAMASGGSEADAAERAAKEAKSAKAASSFPFFSEKIQCQGCSKWGVRYDRIPHVGGHHKLGKTASLGGTDYAEVWLELARLHVEGWPGVAGRGDLTQW